MARKRVVTSDDDEDAVEAVPAEEEEAVGDGEQEPATTDLPEGAEGADDSKKEGDDDGEPSKNELMAEGVQNFVSSFTYESREDVDRVPAEQLLEYVAWFAELDLEEVKQHRASLVDYFKGLFKFEEPEPDSAAAAAADAEIQLTAGEDIDLTPYRASQDFLVVNHSQNPRLFTHSDHGCYYTDLCSHSNRLHSSLFYLDNTMENPEELPTGIGVMVKGQENAKIRLLYGTSDIVSTESAGQALAGQACVVKLHQSRKSKELTGVKETRETKNPSSGRIQKTAVFDTHSLDISQVVLFKMQCPPDERRATNEALLQLPELSILRQEDYTMKKYMAATCRPFLFQDPIMEARKFAKTETATQHKISMRASACFLHFQVQKHAEHNSLAREGGAESADVMHKDEIAKLKQMYSSVGASVDDSSIPQLQVALLSRRGGGVAKHKMEDSPSLGLQRSRARLLEGGEDTGSLSDASTRMAALRAGASPSMSGSDSSSASEVAEARKRAASLKAQLTKQESKIEEMQAQIRQQQTDKANAQTQNKRDKEAKGKAQQELKQLTSELDAYTKRSKAELTKKLKEAAAAEQRQEKLEKELAEAKKVARTAEGETQLLNDELDLLKRRFAALQSAQAEDAPPTTAGARQPQPYPPQPAPQPQLQPQPQAAPYYPPQQAAPYYHQPPPQQPPYQPHPQSYGAPGGVQWQQPRFY